MGNNQINSGTINFGVHLTLDGYEGSPEKLANRGIIEDCLKDLPEKLGMQIIFGPEIIECEALNPKDSGGFSGFVMIAESHISCHTFPKRKFVSIDVYTCKGQLDKQFVMDYFKNAFDLADMEMNYIKRGTRYPERDLID